MEQHTLVDDLILGHILPRLCLPEILEVSRLHMGLYKPIWLYLFRLYKLPVTYEMNKKYFQYARRAQLMHGDFIDEYKLKDALIFVHSSGVLRATDIPSTPNHIRFDINAQFDIILEYFSHIIEYKVDDLDLIQIIFDGDQEYLEQINNTIKVSFDIYVRGKRFAEEQRDYIDVDKMNSFVSKLLHRYCYKYIISGINIALQCR